MSKSGIRWLYGELPRLVEDGVLDKGAAERIRARYGPMDERDARRGVFTAFGLLGATLIGAGIVLLFAHNWNHLGRPARAAIGLGLLLLAQAVAAWVGATTWLAPDHARQPAWEVLAWLGTKTCLSIPCFLASRVELDLRFGLIGERGFWGISWLPSRVGSRRREVEQEAPGLQMPRTPTTKPGYFGER